MARRSRPSRAPAAAQADSAVTATRTAIKIALLEAGYTLTPDQAVQHGLLTPAQYEACVAYYMRRAWRNRRASADSACN